MQLEGSFDGDPSVLVVTACQWEVLARKPGNVHRFADFDNMTLHHFMFSANILGWVTREYPWQDGVGRFIRAACAYQRGQMIPNTTLGIVLLVAPLLRVPDEWVSKPMMRSGIHAYQYDLRRRIPEVLNQLTLEDARMVFQTIREINPGGLGDAAEQDVRSEPTVTLLEAMKMAADRDMIARQYANNYADVFDLGVPAFTDAFAKYGNVEVAVIACQFAWMAAFPDSLIARKRGLTVAEDVQRRVQHVLSLGGLDTPEGRRAGVEFDAYLRSDGNKLNPGTTADLVAACLFVALRENKVTPSAPFRWNVPDWL